MSTTMQRPTLDQLAVLIAVERQAADDYRVACRAFVMHGCRPEHDQAEQAAFRAYMAAQRATEEALRAVAA